MTDDRLHNQDQGTNRPPVELLSAYLDDRESLTSAELEQVELLLAQDRDAQQAYAELQVISRSLGSLEPIAAPRSYHLDAEMVGAPEPVALQQSSAWYARHADAVRWATAAAAVLFVFVLGADLVLNSILSGPSNESNDVFNANQAEITSRNADSDDAAAAADEAGDAEEPSGADAGGGDEAPPVVTPDIVEDDGGASAAAQAGVESDDDDDESAAEPETSALEANPDDGGQAADTAGSESTDDFNADASDESASNQQALKFEEAETGADEADSGRRLWRIAEFSLVVLLGLLITVMVVLPRLGAGSARARGE